MCQLFGIQGEQVAAFFPIFKVLYRMFFNVTMKKRVKYVLKHSRKQVRKIQMYRRTKRTRSLFTEVNKH